MSSNLLQDKLIQPIIGLLKQGITPEKMALSLSLGMVLGIFPALGWTTGLCAIAALSLRLNLPAIQIVNYFMYPVQIALLIPFYRLGEKLFHSAHLPISVPQIYALIRADLRHAILMLWATTWHAIVVWALLAPALIAAAYFTLAPLLRRLSKQQTSAAAEVASC